MSMSIFGKIKDAIFGKKAEAAPAPTNHQDPITNDIIPTAPETVAPAPIQDVDVTQVLEAKLAEKGNPDLNWNSSIVDLMKLLDIDSSLDNRKELATELGYTGAKDGSAEMNIWLHKEVMRQLAANGGRVPGNLTD
jgi:hypothetical protein